MRQSGSGSILRNAGGASLGNSSPNFKAREGGFKLNANRVPPVLPVAGYFYFQIVNWSTEITDQWPRNPIFRSEVHQLYGNSWQLVVYPRGSLNENSSFVEVQLVNRTKRVVQAKYTISLLGQESESQSCNHSWSDPDGTVLFRPHGDDDDYWGTCEFIELATLEGPTFMCPVENSVRFKVEIIANINDELGALTPTTNPMGDVIPGTSLQIARTELQLLSTHMKKQKVRMIKEEERVQDSLVKNRVSMMTFANSGTTPFGFSM